MQGRVAAWSLVGPLLANRNYYDLQGEVIGRDVLGGNLADRVQQKAPELEDLSSTTLYTNLPKPFYQIFLQTLLTEKNEQKGGTAFPFTFNGDQTKTVAESIRGLSLEAQQALQLDKWQSLGWPSQQAYADWLNQPMLFALGGCGHYCAVERVFDYDGKGPDGQDKFRAVGEGEPTKKTHIFSIAGSNFMNVPLQTCEAIVRDPKQPLKNNTKIQMQQSLNAAERANKNNIVLIGAGMGVFAPFGMYSREPENSPRRQLYDEAMSQMLDGWVEALRDYPGPERRTFHCCLPPAIMKMLEAKIARAQPLPYVEIKAGAGDAYTVANALEDAGDTALLINAANHDWMCALDSTKKPGQFADGHSLYASVSDEYYANMTSFRNHSLQNLASRHGNDLSSCIFSSQANDNIASLELISPLQDVLADAGVAASVEATQLLAVIQQFLVKDDIKDANRTLLDTLIGGMQQDIKHRNTQLTDKFFQEHSSVFDSIKIAWYKFCLILPWNKAENAHLETKIEKIELVEKAKETMSTFKAAVKELQPPAAAAEESQDLVQSEQAKTSP